jgi:hypothetical protein
MYRGFRLQLRLGFTTRARFLGFVVETVAFGVGLLKIIRFSPTNYFFKNAPFCRLQADPSAGEAPRELVSLLPKNKQRDTCQVVNIFIQICYAL